MGCKGAVLSGSDSGNEVGGRRPVARTRLMRRGQKAQNHPPHYQFSVCVSFQWFHPLRLSVYALALAVVKPEV